jgi:hypothetical protein
MKTSDLLFGIGLAVVAAIIYASPVIADLASGIGSNEAMRHHIGAGMMAALIAAAAAPPVLIMAKRRALAGVVLWSCLAGIALLALVYWRIM